VSWGNPKNGELRKGGSNSARAGMPSERSIDFGRLRIKLALNKVLNGDGDGPKRTKVIKGRSNGSGA